MKSFLRQLVAMEHTPKLQGLGDFIFGWLIFAVLGTIVILLASSGTEEDDVL